MHSIYKKHQGFEVMFHVATLIPHTPGDVQQVERKRHIGNDMVVVIFKEGKTPFDPNLIRSQFNRRSPLSIYKTSQKLTDFFYLKMFLR